MNRCVRHFAIPLSVALALLATKGRAADLTTADFSTITTSGIMKLCTAVETDPLYQGAIGYCLGYLTGAFHYYKVMEAAGTQPKLVCFTSAEPSRRQELEQFESWVRSHPQYGSDLAIDSLFRFLGEKYPCS